MFISNSIITTLLVAIGIFLLVYFSIFTHKAIKEKNQEKASLGITLATIGIMCLIVAHIINA